MPFRSTAQQRYMYARHPEIARRWTEEMRGKRGLAKEHPIKAANLPGHVEKGLLGSLLRKAPQEAGPIVRSGVTRAGKVGVEIEHQGVKGWGVSHEAARAAWQQNHANRFASGVSKGVARQSVKPLLARRAQLAATAARPVRTSARAIVGKGIGADALKAVKTGRQVASAGWKAGRTGAKPRMGLGAATAVHTSPTMARVGQVAQAAAQRPVITGVVGGGALTGFVDHERNVEKASPMAFAMAGAGERSKRKKAEAKLAQLQAQQGVTKAYGDPEDARYYRLGAGSAALGAGGLAAIGEGGRRVRRDTKELRELRRVTPGRAPKFQRGTWKGNNGKIRAAKPQEKLGEEMAHDVRTKNWLARAQRLEQAKTHARSGMIVHGRPATLVGGGLAALGGAEALRRRASERRWN